MTSAVGSRRRLLVVAAGVVAAVAAPVVIAALLDRDVAPSSSRPPTPRPLGDYATGIFEGNDVPAPSADVQVVNRFQGLDDRRRPVAVYAGWQTVDRDQGVVLHFVHPGPRWGSDGRIVPTPRRSGPVRIERADGTRVVLVAENGDEFTFDYVKRAFE